MFGLMNENLIWFFLGKNSLYKFFELLLYRYGGWGEGDIY